MDDKPYSNGQIQQYCLFTTGEGRDITKGLIRRQVAVRNDISDIRETFVKVEAAIEMIPDSVDRLERTLQGIASQIISVFKYVIVTLFLSSLIVLAFIVFQSGGSIKIGEHEIKGRHVNDL